MKTEKEFPVTDSERTSIIWIVFVHFLLWSACYSLSIFFQLGIVRYRGPDSFNDFVQLVVGILQIPFSIPIAGLVFIVGLLMALGGLLHDIPCREFKRIWLSSLGGFISNLSAILGLLLGLGYAGANF